MMQLSPRGATFIKNFETLQLIGYKPTPNDVPTIGWGATGRGIYVGLRWTLAQAEARFAADVDNFVQGVNRLLAGAPTTQGQFDALVSFAYNVGLDEDADTIPEGLGDSTLLRLHKAGNYRAAADEFLKWDKQKGKVLRGLTRRRAGERTMYLGQTI